MISVLASLLTLVVGWLCVGISGALLWEAYSEGFGWGYKALLHLLLIVTCTFSALFWQQGMADIREYFS